MGVTCMSAMVTLLSAPFQELGFCMIFYVFFVLYIDTQIQQLPKQEPQNIALD